MIILGIDPGTAITGYGVIQTDRRRSLKVLGYGAIRTSPQISMDRRLVQIYESVQSLIEEYGPDCLAIEELFFNRNVSTALTVGQARGVIILAAANRGLPVAEYTPLQVKQSVTGVGRAPKEQVGFMVRLLLGLDEIPRPDDVADALAVGICHAHNGLGWRDRK
ncbi:MAG: crossover junction endodeoxyribonuclease RuvC [Candidatus Wallacebacter cryptica]|jgi:crossover junction endodeoxyribonuclease RuvC|nr:crossover junction endodeoxyribonuclease RuvC [Bacillota bacterium]